MAATAVETEKPYVIARKKAKEYGTAKRIEGALEDGEEVVVLEDIATTGQSAVDAVEALRDAGAVVDRVIVVVDRQEGADELLAEHDIELGTSTTPRESVVPTNDGIDTSWLPMYSGRTTTRNELARASTIRASASARIRVSRFGRIVARYGPPAYQATRPSGPRRSRRSRASLGAADYLDDADRTHSWSVKPSWSVSASSSHSAASHSG